VRPLLGQLYEPVSDGDDDDNHDDDNHDHGDDEDLLPPTNLKTDPFIRNPWCGPVVCDRCWGSYMNQ
jgi:hypothetical protein